MEERAHLRTIFDAALAAVAPDTALLQHVHLEGAGQDVLVADGCRWPLAGRSVRVLGAGKAAAPMAQAVEDLLGPWLHEGLVLVKYEHGLPLQRLELVEGGHPVPDEAGVQATRRMLHMAKDCSPRDLLICLFTGGASALTSVPMPGLSLDDVQQVTRLLLQCGARIEEVNALRKHLTSFGGGQLARASGGAEILSVIVSDVVGDVLDVIASGPTVPDASTFARCAEIIRHYGLQKALPPAVQAHLRAGLAGRLPETPKPGSTVFSRVHNLLVASNRQALQAAAHTAAALGYEPCVLTDTMVGEARQKAVELVRLAQERAAGLQGEGKGLCLLAGGETTVSIQGHGKGGRNQEMALAAALELEQSPHICGLFAGTDGTDGPTDAAGGFAFSDSVQRMGGRAAVLEKLDDNDSYHALQQGGDLVMTGPTRTNVMDLAVLLVGRPAGGTGI